MEPYRDDDLTAALSALRPAPRPAFAAELDARVAAGFPRESRLGEFSPLEAFDRMRALKPRQILLPAGAFALTAIVVATAVTALGGSGSSDNLTMGKANMESGGASEGAEEAQDFDASGSYSGSSTPLKELNAAPSVEQALKSDGAGYAPSEGLSSSSPSIDRLSAPLGKNAAYDATHRAVERSAEITLGTEPAEVGDAAAKVFDVVHANRGVVLSSSTSDGTAGEASAEFELLIPSAKLGDAMAAFSGIAEVRSRHEATDDITAPTVSASEHLQDSQARIDSLLAQLAEAETEGEREAVEAELASERRRASGLRASLQDLERRANLSRVELRIESDEAGAAPDAGGSWGVGDALGDAGRILAVGAAVSLVGLAIVGPLALIALLAWLAHRAWIHRARRQALG